MTKLYLHYDGSRGPEHTFVWRHGGSGPITGQQMRDAMVGFVENYSRKHGKAAGVTASSLKLVAEDPLGVGRPVTVDVATDDKLVDPELVSSGSDLKVVDAPERSTALASKRRLSASEKAGGGVAGKEKGAPPPGKGKEEAVDVSSKVKKLVAEAEKLATQGNLRGARDLLKEALRLDPRNGKALRRMTSLLDKAGLSEKAFVAAKECCSSARNSGPADFLQAGRCLIKLGRHAEARTALMRARSGTARGLADDVDATLAECFLKLGDGPGAANLYMQVLERTGEKHVEALVGYGKFAILVNQVDKAVQSLLKAIITDQGHKETRKVMAQALGMPVGMATLRQQVAPSPDSASVYSFLGTVCKDHGEIDASIELLKVAVSIDPRSASSALGLVHIHEIAGDYERALSAAKAFLAANLAGGVGRNGARNSDVLRILEGVPPLSPSSTPVASSPSSWLACRGVEVHWTVMQPVRERRLWAAAPALEGGMTSNAEEVSFAWCSCPLSDSATAAAVAASAMEVEEGAETVTGEPTPSGESGGSSGSNEGASGGSEGVDGQESEGPGTAVGRGDGSDLPPPTAAEASDDARGQEVYAGWLKASGGKEFYSPGDLDVLALCFAVVKILYLEGQWLCLPDLLGLLEPTRIQSLMPIHGTSIRNEQAYYCCIAQLLSSEGHHEKPPVEISGPSTPEASCVEPDAGGGDDGSAREVIYVCGDSHTLTPAWREVKVGGRRRVLRPALVTGLKHWHLRPESNFYPKKNFERVMAKIPENSAVVFIFGEIDCREGILVALDKLRYGTVAEGVEHTVGIFIEVAEELAKERRLKIFVHPVIPVLNETRSMVKTYNRVFRRLVRKSKYLHWLDFFDGLLDETRDMLRPEFHLDGTHLAPNYVGLLSNALEHAWVA